MSIIRPLDVDRLAVEFRDAKPFPFIKIDGFLDPEFAAEVAATYPAFESAAKDGQVFESVNEHLKLQVTERDRFPDPVKRLQDALSSREFLDSLVQITGIEDLRADAALSGGGMHQTGTSGRLDVHVDFNRLEPQGWHRRLNILIYLNPAWKREWGGNLELWDQRVKNCYHSLEPQLNRCVVFETSEISYHGVGPVTCPAGVSRKSFAGYYYTEAPPSGSTGPAHGTVFRARPSEPLKGLLLMPMEKLAYRTRRSLRGLKSAAKRLIGQG